MSTLEVQDQPTLGVRRTVFLTLTGIRYRLFRSIVSVVVITVAIAFFMNVLSASLIQRSIRKMASKRLRELRQASAWIAYLSHAGTLESILVELSKTSYGEPLYREMQVFGSLSNKEMASCVKDAQQATEYRDYFNTLDYNRRRIISQGENCMQIFERLHSQVEWNQFKKNIATLHFPQFATSLKEFRAFLSRWPSSKDTIQRIHDGRVKAISRIEKALKGQSLLESLAHARGRFGDIIRTSGFVLEPDTAEVIEAQAQSMLSARFLEESIKHDDIRRVVAAYWNLLPADITPWTLWDLLADSSSASWYLKTLKAKGVTGMDLDAQEVVRLARIKKEERILSKAERLDAEPAGGFMGLGQRIGWLLIISMLVCGVGITNAMLMSVTERFREIATLKCLGALDGTIMAIFVLEACLLGIIGGIAGAVVGCILGLVRMTAIYGSIVLSAIPGTELLMAIALSILMGIALAGIGAIFPSFKAARLAPMEAMRIE